MTGFSIYGFNLNIYPNWIWLKIQDYSFCYWENIIGLFNIHSNLFYSTHFVTKTQLIPPFIKIKKSKKNN